ncbi:hypothetical protein LBMAG42_42590 [Deltaproteobacteria bacterium]|nr:hypothetical protein LBMAG42_42590 [Deltaproteobacteria bacterium]
MSDLVEIREDADVSAAARLVREIGDRSRLSGPTTESLITVIAALATNQLRHASRGRILVRTDARDGVPGVEIEAVDAGPGIADPTASFAEESRRSGARAGGLASVRRLSAEVDLDVRAGEGTRIVARMYDRPVPRRRTVTILGRPLPGGRMSGDASAFWRGDAFVRVMLCDGLGHGAEARQASELAIRTANAIPDAAPEAVLAACDAALRPTRGAAVTMVHVDERGHLTGASVGNIEAGVCQGGVVSRLPAQPGVVGSGRARERLRPSRLPMPRGSIFVLATDGSTYPLAECRVADTAGVPPWVLAQRILERCARDTDDAMVVVVV